MKEVPFNPDSGQLIYSNGLLRGLLESGAEGTLVAHHRPEADQNSFPTLAVKTVPLQKKVRALSLLTRSHSDSYRNRSKAFARALVDAMSSKPDFVLIDYFAMGWVLPLVKECIQSTGKKVLLVYVSHNFESTLRFQVAANAKSALMRSVLRIDAFKAARLERALVADSDLVVVNTDEDGTQYRKMAPGKAILTLTPSYDGEIIETRTLTADVPKRVIVVGAFDWIAKQSNLQRFLESAELKFKKAQVDVLVVGRAPEAFIVAMSSRFDFCKFTGRVEDVKPYLSGGRVGVMPDEVGGGFKHKYLYYVFAGLPVATIRSQVAGLPIDPDRDFITRETMDELVDAIVGTIDNLPELNAMRERCWGKCASAFSWRDRGIQLVRQMQLLLGGAPS
jgi:glycosyltransferase involved in cell wall biosynthesis